MSVRPRFLQLAILLLVTLAPPLRAQNADQIPDSPAGKEFRWVLDWLASDFTEQSLSHFHESFLQAVPPPQLRAAHAQIGTLFREPAQPEIVSVTPQGDNALVAIVRETNSGTVVRVGFEIDPEQGTIVGFVVGPAPEMGDRAETWDALRDRLDEMPANLSVGAWELTDAGLRPVFEHKSDNRLAIGSTCKLYVLGALSKLIDQGEANWDEMLAIREELKSLPSGTMQNQPAGSEFTLQRFATLMISISDNTATDHLIHRVGRERVEQHMASLHAEPARNLPFLTTHEMFKIKLSGNPDLPGQYGKADEPTRRAMLAEGGAVAQAKAQLNLASTWIVPIEIERVEWFATARECADAMASLWQLSQRDGLGPLLDVLSANPGIPIDRETWPRTLFKGGSEPGVINLTWLLEDSEGRVFLLSLGWNNPEASVDQAVIIERAFDAISLLHD